jgi:hypothetical protein
MKVSLTRRPGHSKGEGTAGAIVVAKRCEDGPDKETAALVVAVEIVGQGKTVEWGRGR